MMEDYERVTELQEISQRSAGATAAQAGVFLKGMEASLNNIQVAWEKIVMTLTDSKIIIGTLDIAGKALDKIGDSLKDTRKQVGLFTTLATIGALMLGNKLREHDIAKQENKLALERSIIEQKAAIEKRQNFIDNSTQILKDQQEQEIKKANNEIILAQEKELGLQEEHNKAVAASALGCSGCSSGRGFLGRFGLFRRCFGSSRTASVSAGAAMGCSSTRLSVE